MWLSVAAAVLGAVGVVAWGLATQSGTNRIAAGLVGVGTLLVVLVLVWRRTWIDTESGTLCRSVLGVRRGCVRWAEATTIDLERNRAGQLALRVGGNGTIRITVLALDLGGGRGMAPSHLRLLAEQLLAWAPRRERVARALLEQADFLAAGGDVRDSPLASRV